MSDNELGDLLVKIAHINHRFTDEHFVKSLGGDVLTYTAMKLAAMKSSIIDLKVSAHKDMLRKEIEMDREKALAYKRAMKDSTATAAKDAKYSDEEFIKAREAYAESKVNYEKLRSITADTHDLIESIRSRIIDLQSSRKDESIR